MWTNELSSSGFLNPGCLCSDVKYGLKQKIQKTRKKTLLWNTEMCVWRPYYSVVYTPTLTCFSYLRCNIWMWKAGEKRPRARGNQKQKSDKISESNRKQLMRPHIVMIVFRFSPPSARLFVTQAAANICITGCGPSSCTNLSCSDLTMVQMTQCKKKYNLYW